MARENEGLQQLGRKTEYKMDYAPEVLETFVNKHPGNDYWVQFNCPEFTSLCPITGQPDEYIINKNKNIYLFIITIYRCMYIYSYRDKRTIGQNMKKWRKSACSTARYPNIYNKE